MPKRHRAHLGQVFLSDVRVERHIVSALDLKSDDAVLEIGAGPGNMTAQLASAAAKVFAVELDARWAAALHVKFGDRPNVSIIERDILKLGIDEVARDAGRERIRVFGNLPYYITSPTLLHLFHYHTAIHDIVVMVQKEVAERIVAAPGTQAYGLLTLTCAYYTDPKLLFTIPPSAFRRPPKVDSALVRMNLALKRDALGIGDEERFWKWMRAAFAQKRKTLVNNWKSLCGPGKLDEVISAQGIDVRARAESLSLAQLARLYTALNRRSGLP